MGILSEQNILGNPALAIATRPGADTAAADYAFPAPMVYQMEEGNIVNPKFMTPSSYSFDKTMGTIVKSDATGTYTGVDGESITFAQAQTQYGPPAGNKLADSQGTNLTSAAEVIAGKAKPIESISTLSSENQAESMRNKTVTPGTGVAVASGGDTVGFSADHKYQDVNKSDWQGDMALATAAAEPASTENMGHGSQASDTKKSGPPLSGEGSMESFQEAMQSGGETTPPAQTQNPMYGLMGIDPPGVGAGTTASPPAVGSDEYISEQSAKHGMPLP